MGSIEEHNDHSDWSLQTGEIDQFCETVPNKEKDHFWNLVNQIEKEIDDLAKIIQPSTRQIDLLEVFCSDCSAITDQVQKLGGTSIRFGRTQGDLETAEGRRALFVQLLKHRPKNVWMSPTCGPWSKWSQFNSLRSIAAFDSIQHQRFSMLSQVALCLVLCRYQHRKNQHAHWEQPKGSYMMRLPYIQEIYRYLLRTMPDLCNAGNLKDPENKLPMQKGLHIMTSSQRLHDAIHHLKCTRDHVHQQIEGSTKVHGQTVARSELSEIYPRKFGRLVAKTLLKIRFPLEKPAGTIADPVLIMLDAIAAEANAATVRERPTKRYKPNPRRGVKTPAAAGAPDSTGDAKRQKSEVTTSSNTESTTNPIEHASEQIQKIAEEIEKGLPRVGKRVINNSAIIQALEKEFPNMTIKAILACKGTNRRMGPPNQVHAQEAPYRRSIMKIRDTNEIMIDAAWEEYANLSNRKIIRASPPCRVNITMFAAKPNASSDCLPGVSENSPEPRAKVPETPEVSRTHEPDEVSETKEKLPTAPEQSENFPRQSFQTNETHQEVQAEDRPSTTDQGDEAHGARFKALPREEQAMLKRAHKNLCHPSAEQLSATLRNQGCRPEIHQAVFDMKCPTCAASQKPKLSRPSSLKPELDFNDKVFMDGVKWTSKQGQSFHFYHLIDQATNFHVAIPAPNRTAEHAIQKTMEAWLQWAGPPNMLVTDPATEFTSDLYQEFLQRYDIKGITTSPNAHWQNGQCERHGEILQHMLTKIDLEQPITTFWEFHQALVQSTNAKNTLSIRRGYSPEILVFGKSSKVPGSIASSEDLSAHESANREDAQGIQFRRSLALRERARIAFHQADNDQALRRACLRRSRPDRQSYNIGEWVMIWQPQKTGSGYWIGPAKVIQVENQLSVWATMGGKLHRRALEHVRPVCSSEARQISEVENQDPENHQHQSPTELPLAEIPNNPENPNNNQHQNIQNPPDNLDNDGNSQSQDQPDNEPEGENSESNPHDDFFNQPIDTPLPESSLDDDLVTTHILCVEDEILTVDPAETPCAWRCEFEVPSHLAKVNCQGQPPESLLLATTEKKQRTEVKLTTLTVEEQAAFKKAKESEIQIQNWLSTGTVSKILRDKLAPEQIIRCRWILVWKPLEEAISPENAKGIKSEKLKTHKPKARLVVLGYLDPNLTEVPRDSPTLGRQSKMLLLQLISSKGWSLGSFDIKAAFLQGRTQKDRVMGMEPVPELAKALQLAPNEVCKLDKSAYGLIDAPFLWFKTLSEELINLGMQPSPFDPCVFILRHPKTNEISGVLGIHVDDGIYGGDEYFHSQISKLEEKYPFGSKKSKAFTFTGIELFQHPDNSIELSQTKYVNHIPAIQISQERKLQENEKVTEKERHHLRGLVGSLQYAAVHTRPDIASALSHLQSQINSATVATLLTANKVLHNAKKHSDVHIKIQPIKTEDLRFIAFSDASFASKSKPESHAGMIILATHSDIAKNQSCPISPISWGTKKIQRIVTSTLSAETSALSTTLDQLTWLRIYWAWILDPKTEWQRPEVSQNLPPAFSIPTYKAQENDFAITDCKSLYDLTTRTAIPNCQEFRTQLLARSIKDILTEGIKLHWVHSGAQLADSLTKVMEATFLRETLRKGRYCLHDSDEVLKDRASARNRLKWLRSSTDQMSTKSENF
jgi:transposase InsO family protein